MTPYYVALGTLAVVIFIAYVIYCLMQVSYEARIRREHNVWDTRCKFFNFGSNEPVSWSAHCKKCNPRRY